MNYHDMVRIETITQTNHENSNEIYLNLEIYVIAGILKNNDGSYTLEIATPDGKLVNRFFINEESKDKLLKELDYEGNNI